jgi:putative addiction module CopG family antidote
MPAMTVSLPQPLVDFAIEREVNMTGYGNASEVVRGALRLLSSAKAREPERLATLYREIAVGLDDARHGRFSERSMGEIAEAVGSSSAPMR